MKQPSQRANYHPLFSDFRVHRPEFEDLTKAEPQPKPSSRTKLTIDQIQAIRLSYRSFPVSQRQLATLFGLSYNQVYRAVNNWSDTETQKD